MSQILKVYTYILLDKRVGGKYMLETKKCKGCGEVKSVEQFHKTIKSKKTGEQLYRAKCKSCLAEERKEYLQIPEVKEHTKERERKYKREYNKRPEVKEYIREYKRVYDQRPDVKDRIREYARDYAQNQRAIHYGVSYSPDISEQYKETKEMLGGSCAYCVIKLTSDNEHWEHIIPLSVGGTHTPDNIVCSCDKCNLSKHTRPMEEWYREQPFFSEERLQQIYAIRDYWKAVGFEVVYPTEDQIKEAHSVAEDTLDTIQNMSRLQRDPKVIQEYI